MKNSEWLRTNTLGAPETHTTIKMRNTDDKFLILNKKVSSYDDLSEF